jgi:D-glycero-D-manno-heptose 1,7-bisphosphate phosphatase
MDTIPKKKAIFLDRDGVLCKATPKDVYLTDPKDFEIIPAAPKIVKEAKKMGYLPVVITNQQGLAKGVLSQENLDEMHGILCSHIPEIEHIYVCGHHKDDNCDCRKPKGGLLRQAAADLNIDLASSIMIGDRKEDIAASRDAGVGKAILVKSEFYPQEKDLAQPDGFAENHEDILSHLD